MLRTFWQLIVFGGLALVLLLLAPCMAATAYAQSQALSETASRISTFASGLDNPRGLAFGPDGNLYVAEAGEGGTNSANGKCTQVPAPVGPYTGGMTSRISKISPSGARSTVIDKLPSAKSNPKTGGEILGVSAVAFVGDTLYALLSGGGCSHGSPQETNGVFRVNGQQHTWQQIADLSHFIQTHLVKKPSADDFEPDGTWYSMIQENGRLYAVEPNHGELDRIETNGTISRIADISASQGHSVPTAVAFHNGDFYVGNLGLFPIQQGSAKILKITPSGQVSDETNGLTTVLGLSFDCKGQMYALENTVGKSMPAPGAGRIVRIASGGKLDTVASGLNFPTAMTFGPDGNLYVSNFGFGAGPGKGQIERIDAGIKCS
ncbi:ScyD/ScyE family protein [Ktedonosporobacter rubrisoli]|nr:ScyD/ScyE family protein [Ktedonosporobacter rubrisoli]